MKFGLVMTIANVVTFFKVSDALFFGFNIQDPAGNTIAGANANQTGALFGIGFLLASLGLLKKNNNRGRRDAPEITNSVANQEVALIDNVLRHMGAIECYQKMVCDIGTGAPYSTAADMIELMHIPPVLSPQAEDKMRSLQQAFTVGRHVKNVNVCQQVYHACTLSGSQIDKMVSEGMA